MQLLSSYILKLTCPLRMFLVLLASIKLCFFFRRSASIGSIMLSSSWLKMFCFSMSRSSCFLKFSISFFPCLDGCAIAFGIKKGEY